MQKKAYFWLLVILLESWTTSAGCPDGWQPYFSTDKCIKGFRTETTWLGAYEDCRKYSKDGNLVSIHSPIQNAAVATVAQETFSACLYWIGLTSFFSTSNYTWSDDSPFDYANWAPGDPPSDPAGTTVYLSLDASFRWLTTREIAETNCYVCSQPLSSTSAPTTCDTANGWQNYIGTDNKCIKGFGNETDWLSAYQFCMTQGKNGNLVSIHSTFENACVATVAQQTFPACDYWLGLNGASKAWTWTDSSDFDYKNWDIGYPPVNPDGLTTFFVLTARNRWQSTNENAEKHCFICEHELA